MSQQSTPYAVPAVGMRKCMICPVCGDAFLATSQHRWIAYIPRMRYEKPVCSYHCMREMERKLGRWQSIRFIEPEEEEELSSIHALPPRVDRSAAYHPAKTPQKPGRRKR